MNAGLRVHQGRPRGTSRHRRGLHERHRRADRAGRLADDVFPDPRRQTVLLRHLLPESRIPAAACRPSATPGGNAAARSSRPPTRSPASCARWRPDCPAAARRCTAALCDHAVAAVLGDEDAVRGGFWRLSAPKFPPSALLEALLRSLRAHRSSRRRWAPSSAPARRWPAVASTTSWPAASPATASTTSWVVPHFEKMLYDNALLLRAYAHWARRTGIALGAQGRRARPHGS